ncbi:7853_t:CDS:1, partial [Entrophospora sp. SA101]
QISSKILAGELLCKDKIGGKSDVWLRFAEVFDKEDKSCGYVICKNCQHLYKYNSKEGTSNLIRHVCSSSTSNQRNITSFLTKKVIPTKVKEDPTKKIVNFVCKDLCPFETIVGLGFQELAQEFIKIGSIYGNVSIEELLPHPTTISRNTLKEAELVKSALAESLLEFFRISGGAFTTDCWTDNYRKISYISLTVHFIDNWDLKEYVLAVSKFPEISHTSDIIQRTIFSLLRGYNLQPESKIKRYAFVTDSGANFVAAFQNYKHLSCIAH